MTWDGTVPPRWLHPDPGTRPMARRRRRSALRMPSYEQAHWVLALLLLAACVVSGLLYSIEGMG